MSYQLSAKPAPTWANTDEKVPNYIPDWATAREVSVELPRAVRPWSERFPRPFTGHTQPEADLLNVMDLSEPWTNNLEPQYSEDAVFTTKRLVRLQMWWRGFLRTNPFLPFTLRGLALCFNASGLAIACRIYELSAKYPLHLKQQPSTYMAICVLSVAIPYLIYSIYDEFSGQPLGLRAAISKMKFVILDVTFICFGSANLALAFASLYDPTWVCELDHATSLCHGQINLVGLIFVSLLLWLVTFFVSTFRMIDRAG